MTLTWDELSPEQKHDAKEAYLTRLADEGRFVEVIYGDGGEERDPSYWELGNADKLVPDDVMRAENVCYVPEDFASSSPDDPRLFTPEFVHEWCNLHLTALQYEADNKVDVCPLAVRDGLKWARSRVQDFCERFLKGQLTHDEQKGLPNED